MISRLNNLSLIFQTKGFLPIEMTGLIKDAFAILDTNEYCTLTEVNQELESLGWGIEILDKVTYAILEDLVGIPRFHGSPGNIISSNRRDN